MNEYEKNRINEKNSRISNGIKGEFANLNQKNKYYFEDLLKQAHKMEGTFNRGDVVHLLEEIYSFVSANESDLKDNIEFYLSNLPITAAKEKERKGKKGRPRGLDDAYRGRIITMYKFEGLSVKDIVNRMKPFSRAAGIEFTYGKVRDILIQEGVYQSTRSKKSDEEA